MQSVYIFLASPGDVSKERAAVEEVVSELNRTTCPSKGVNLVVKEWKKDTYPGYGKDAQAIVNEQIAEMSGYHLFVGIMWNRLGTPTPRAESGTVEEFELAVEAYKAGGRPEIWFYFREAKAELKSADELAQRAKVLEFKKRIESNGLPRSHKTVAKFKDEFRQHLTRWLNDKSFPTPSSAPSAASSPAPGVTGSKAAPSASDPFAADLAEVVQLLGRRESVNVVVPKVVSQKAVGDEIVRLVKGLALVDLENPVTAARPGLIEAMLRAFGVSVPIPDRKPDDLVVFGRQIERLSYTQLVILHADILGQSQRQNEYGADFFHAIKNATTDSRKLGLVLVSRQPFGKLLPPDHELSHIAIKTVELRPPT